MPSARLDARNITLDGFTETGGGFSALNWDEIEQKSLLANLGASLAPCGLWSSVRFRNAHSRIEPPFFEPLPRPVVTCW